MNRAITMGPTGIFCLCLLAPVLVQCGPDSASAAAQAGPAGHPNMYLNSAEIQAIRAKVQANQQPWKTAYDRMIANANAALSQVPLSVTYQGPIPPSGDVHDFYNARREVDPARPDYGAAIALGRAVRSLGLGYAFTGDQSYANKAVQLIRVWALDPSTRMTPKFTTWWSYIELCTTLPGMFYGADLIWNHPGWISAEKAAFRSWAAAILESAKNREAYANYQNNFENWRVLFISSAAAIAEDPASLAYAFQRWKEIIPIQMGSDGRMLLEIVRTTGLTYSIYAVNAMIQTAEIARHHGVNLYDYKLSDGRGLEKALDYLAPYVVTPSTWPYQQVSPPDASVAAPYELAYLWKQKPSYLAAINAWGRPLTEGRTMGPVTLTHAFGAYPFTPGPVTPPPPPSPTNLAPNAGFETDPAAAYFTHGSGTFTWTTDAAHGGSRSLKVVSAQPVGALARWLSRNGRIAATPGQTYQASAWLKTAGVQQHGCLTLNFWGPNLTYLGGASSGPVTGTTGWTQRTVQATAPAGTVSMRIEFRLHGPGTLWADDVVVSR